MRKLLAIKADGLVAEKEKSVKVASMLNVSLTERSEA
jgi:hypothetical protein